MCVLYTVNLFSPLLPPEGSPTLSDRLAYTPILYYIIIVITKNRRRVSLQWRWRGGDWITKTTAVYSSPTSESRVYFYDTTKRRPATAPAPATHYLRQFIFYNIFRSDIFVAQKIKSTAVIAINDCVHIMSSNEN